MKTLCVSFEHLADLDIYQSEKPYLLTQLPSRESEEIGNLKFVQCRDITIHDVRGHEAEFKLDIHAFEFHSAPSKVLLDNTQESEAQYIHETLRLVKQRFGSDRVICYDIRVVTSIKISAFYAYDSKKRFNADITAEQKSSNDRNLPAPAVTAIHIDHTREGGLHRIKRHLTVEEEAEYLNGDYRLRIINVWRPLFRTIEDAPLGYCDARTIADSDLIKADRVSPAYAGEIYYVRPSSSQKWYWLSRQRPEEIAIFLSFDSMQTSLASPVNSCAHVSFKDPTARSDIPPRESVEVRIIVINKLSNP